MKKVLYVVIIVLVVWLIQSVGHHSDGGHIEGGEHKTIIGAVLPMTGATAVYGEQMKFGIEYAIKKLGVEDRFVLRVEDSQGLPAAGVSAYNKLLGEKTDIFISAFSAISVPLSQLAKTNEKPLIMTIVSAMDAVSDDNNYAYRIFSNSETTTGVHTKTIKAKGFNNIGILYINDAYGNSLNEVLLKEITKKGIAVTSESYNSDQPDYRTQLQKLKAKNVDAVVFIGIPPAALQNFIKQKNELDLNFAVIDGAGVLPGAGALDLLGEQANGVYTFATLFDLGLAGQDLKDELVKNKLVTTYAAAHAYDVVKYIVEVSDFAKKNNISFEQSALQLDEFSGIQGNYDLVGGHKQDLQPRDMIPVQVVDGKFVEVK